EDGIRDLIVTGVQTCALPIFLLNAAFGHSAPLSSTMNMFGPSPGELLVAPARPTPASSESATPSVLRSTSPSKNGMVAIMSGTPNTAPRESVASVGNGAASA